MLQMHLIQFTETEQSSRTSRGVDKVIVDSTINASHYGKNDAEDKEIRPLLNSCVLPRCK